MGSPITTTVREPGFTISREADYNLASIESAATRAGAEAIPRSATAELSHRCPTLRA